MKLKGPATKPPRTPPGPCWLFVMAAACAVVVLTGHDCWSQETSGDAVAFPLRLHASKRFLVDAHSRPFLVREISAWGLIQTQTEEDAEAFLDAVTRRGFNTVLVNFINSHNKMTGEPTWKGVAPLNEPWDFSTPNEAYFAHVDRFLAAAERRGVLVLATPLYLGYHGLAGEGLWDEILSETNSPEKMLRLGRFLGRRYKSAPNLVWVAGGDNSAGGDLQPLVRAMIDGVRSEDAGHYWTGHFDSNSGHHWSTDNELYRDVIDIDGEYVWTEASLGDKGPQYAHELEQYHKGKMTIQLDQSYEHDVPHYADNENPQWRRRKMYDGLLSGCAGTSFSPGTLDEQCYFMRDWRAVMDTVGMRETGFCFNLFLSRPWSELVPDESDQIVVSGRKGPRDIDTLCAAKTRDGRHYIAYIPTGRTFELATQAISPGPLCCYWYNPRDGSSMKIGAVGPSPRFGFATPSDHDWVLVMDLDSLDTPPPGVLTRSSAP